MTVANSQYDSNGAMNGSMYCVKIIKSNLSADEIAKLATSCQNGKVIISSVNYYNY